MLDHPAQQQARAAHQNDDSIYVFHDGARPVTFLSA
jgi:hypothetical protein